MCAVAAIEIACWDIIGKATNQPIYNLWGGRCHEKLRAYANGWYRGPRTPESFAEKAKIVAGRGYTAMKFDPFGSAWRTLSTEDFDLSLDIIRAVREAVGPKVDLLIEGHCRFNVPTALKFAEAMAPCRPTWFEEPVPHTNIAAMVEVARHSAVPIATGESLSTKQQFAELLKHEVVNIIQPEPLNVGGIFARTKDLRHGGCALRCHRSPQCAGAGLLRGMRPTQRIASQTSSSTKSSTNSTSRGKRKSLPIRCTWWMAISKFRSDRDSASTSTSMRS